MCPPWDGITGEEDESKTSPADPEEKWPSNSCREGEVRSLSMEGVLSKLRSNEEVLACRSKEEMLVCLSKGDVRLPCLTNLSSVGLRVRGGGPFSVLLLRRPNSSRETPLTLLLPPSV